MKIKMTKGMTARMVRWATLFSSTAFFLFFSRVVSEHAICPIGGFEMFFTGIFNTGFTLAGLFSGMVIIFLIMSAVSILFRRAYCAYICPLGALQELFERLGALVLPRKFRESRMPPKVDRALRWGKYIVLASFVVFAGLIGGHWMIRADPYIALMGLGSLSQIVNGIARNPGSYAFLALILVFSLFRGRGFCKYICPAGAWYGILSKVSPNRVVRDEGACVDCGLCTRSCPMGIDVAHLKEVKTAECLGCRECVNACPKAGALAFPLAKVEVPAVLVPIASAAVFSGAVFVAAHMSGGDKGHRPPPNGGEAGAYRGETPTPSADKTVGFGGCPACVGCGICGAPSIT